MSSSLCTTCLPFQTKIFQIIRLKVWELLCYHVLRRYEKYIYFFFPFLLQPIYLSKLSIKIMGTCFATNMFLFYLIDTKWQNRCVKHSSLWHYSTKRLWSLLMHCLKNLTFLLFVSHEDRIRCAKVVKRKAIWWRLESTPYGLHAAIQFMLTRVSKFKSSSVFNVQHGWNALCKQIATKKIL